MLQFVGEYCNVLHTLYLMECERSAGLDAQQLQVQRDQFLGILRNLLKCYGHESQAKVVVFRGQCLCQLLSSLSASLVPPFSSFMSLALFYIPPPLCLHPPPSSVFSSLLHTSFSLTCFLHVFPLILLSLSSI